MLFMSIYTYEPEKRNEIIKRRLERGAGAGPGLKVVGEWIALEGHRGFMVFEAEDPKAVMATTLAWSDLCRFEYVSIMEAEQVMKMAKAVK